MQDDFSPQPTQQNRREPLFNAPVIAWGMAALLVGLHALVSFAPFPQQIQWQYDYALVPRRFWAEAGSPDAYPDLFASLVTLLTTGFLHADWMHVLVNAAMLLAFGTGVARVLGADMAGVVKWLVVYLASVIVGSIAYLALNGVDAGAAVGASGGTSGLMGAAMIAAGGGGPAAVMSRQFLGFTAVFAIANVIFVLAGPSLIGMAIAWEAHAGGYAAGAVAMALLGPRLRPPAGTVGEAT
jgi:membrane associated rhomboid family serine protease